MKVSMGKPLHYRECLIRSSTYAFALKRLKWFEGDWRRVKVELQWQGMVAPLKAWRPPAFFKAATVPSFRPPLTMAASATSAAELRCLHICSGTLLHVQQESLSEGWEDGPGRGNRQQLFTLSLLMVRIAQALERPLEEAPPPLILHSPVCLPPPLRVHHPPHTRKHCCSLAGVQQGVVREGKGEGRSDCALNHS